MNSNVKSAGVAHAEPARGFYRVAIVGAASLKGKEVAEVLEQRNFPSTEVKLLDDDETLGQLEALKDEITFIQAIRVDPESHHRRYGLYVLCFGCRVHAQKLEA